MPQRTIQQNKKRKLDETFEEDSFDDENSSTHMSDDEDDTDVIFTEKQSSCLEQTVFSNMTEVNSGLITLNTNLLSVDYSYMLNHGEMVDEFVSNIHQFLNHLGVLRKKLASERLNSDTLSSIYQFLEPRMLLLTCQYVCKMWREALNKASLSASFKKKNCRHMKSMKNFKFAHRITSLSVCNTSLDSIKVLSSTKRLKGIETLSLEDLGDVRVSKICTSKRLKPKNLFLKSFSALQVEKVLNSKLASNIERLELDDSSVAGKIFQNLSFPKLEYLSLSSSGTKSSIFDLAANCTNLKTIEITNANLDTLPDTITFPSLTSLRLNVVKFPKQFLFQLTTSKFPNLQFLYLKNNNLTNLSETVNIPEEPNFNCPIQEIVTSNYMSFSQIAKPCKNLKHLKIIDIYMYQGDAFDFLQYFPPDCLTSVERLEFSDCTEIVFSSAMKSPCFPNLKELIFNGYGSTEILANYVRNSPLVSTLKKLVLRGQEICLQ